MASRSKSIFLILLVLVVLVAAGVFYLTSNLNGLVTTLIEEQGSAATQSAVRVTGLDIRLTDASASLSGLSVANPEGFAGEAIELGDFAVTLDAASLTSDVIVVKDISVDGARINVLQQGSRNNLRELLANLPAGDPDETAPASDEGARKLIIERFSIANASASLSIPELGEDREVTLPSIVVTDIGKATNGATGAQVAKQLLAPVMNAAISSAAAASVKERVGEKVGEVMGGLLDKLGKKKKDE